MHYVSCYKFLGSSCTFFCICTTLTSHSCTRKKSAQKTHGVQINKCKKNSREPNLKCRDQIQDFVVLNAKTWLFLVCTNLVSRFPCSLQLPFVCGRPPHFSTCLSCEHRSIRNLYQIGSGFRSLIKVCEYLVRTQNGHVATSATQPNSRRKKFNKRVAS